MNKVFEYLDNFLKDNDCIVIGVSGGPDSMALLDILSTYKDKLNLKIIAAFVDHSTREEIDDERKLVQDYCEEKNIIFEETKIVEKIDKNFEMEARKIRYDFFKSLIKKYNANYLFTAHHEDDLAETILMRISRGSVLKGYKGINLVTKKNGYSIVRPLLHTDKDNILKYLDDNNIKYAIDKTNDEDDHTRNRIRHHVIPYLKKEYKNIKFFEYYKELDMYDKFIDKYLDDSKIVVNNKIDLEKYNKEDILIKRKSIERYLNDIYDGYLEIISSVHVDEIVRFIENNKVSKTLDLPDNYIATLDNKHFIITKKKEYNDIDIYFTEDLEVNNYKFIYNADSDLKSNYVLRLDSSEIKLPLHIRSRKDKDKMEVKNLGGSKSISDILTDSKLCYEKRKNIVLITDNCGTILWIPGIKKSKFDKEITEKYDIIIKCVEEEE